MECPRKFINQPIDLDINENIDNEDRTILQIYS